MTASTRGSSAGPPGPHARTARPALSSRTALVALALSTPAIGGSAPSLTVIDLQEHRVQTTLDVAPSARMTLIDLNPGIGSWYLLRITRPDGTLESFHLENPDPAGRRLRLAEGGSGPPTLTGGLIEEPCSLWPTRSASPLSVARESRRPFGDLCNARLLLRNQTSGRRTKREWATDLLRDRFRYGEQITSFVKERFFRDRYRITGKLRTSGSAGEGHVDTPRPSSILLDSVEAAATLTTPDLNFIINQPPQGIAPGRWYPLDGYPGIFLSAVTPALVSEAVTRAQQSRVNPLDAEEASALVYLVAFDLSLFDLGFALGTEHPRLGWSDRVPETSRDPSLPGPDGIDGSAPLVRTGILSPFDVPRAAAAFAGGFKRTHGGFRWGSLANENHGSHYGFIENGVVLSTLQPGLATLLVSAEGRVEMKTWSNLDSVSMRDIRYARQNGVPLIELPPGGGMPRPGELVRDWAKGNWSGSDTKQLRTLRSGVCIQESPVGRFLIYGYFSAATPSAMARVFQACDCSYAMHMDMNAPEHTYLAIYRIVGSEFVVQRLVREMAEVDPPVDGKEVPRFVGYADNRDFFYLLRRDDGADTP